MLTMHQAACHHLCECCGFHGRIRCLAVRQGCGFNDLKEPGSLRTPKRPHPGGTSGVVPGRKMRGLTSGKPGATGRTLQGTETQAAPDLSGW